MADSWCARTDPNGRINTLSKNRTTAASAFAIQLVKAAMAKLGFDGLWLHWEIDVDTASFVTEGSLYIQVLGPPHEVTATWKVSRGVSRWSSGTCSITVTSDKTVRWEFEGRLVDNQIQVDDPTLVFDFEAAFERREHAEQSGRSYVAAGLDPDGDPELNRLLIEEALIELGGMARYWPEYAVRLQAELLPESVR